MESHAEGTASTREAARGTGLIMVGSLISLAAEYVYRMTLARGLGVEGFGTFSQARSVYLIVVIVASLGMGLGVKRFVAYLKEAGREREARRSIRDGASVLLVTTLLAGTALFLLAGRLAAVFDNPALMRPIQVLAFAVPAAAGLEFVTRIGEAFRSFAPTVIARRTLDPVLRLIASLALVLAGAALPVLMGAYVASAVIACGVAIVLVARLDRLRRLSAGPAPSQLRPLLDYALPLVFGGILFDIVERVDILMIGLYRDESQVGIYAAGSAIARFLLMFLASTLPVVSTLAAEHAGRGEHAEISRLHRTTARWMLIYAGPVATIFLLYARELITLLFGADYAAAAPACRLLVVGYTVTLLVGPLGVFLDALGRTRWSMANMMVRTGVNVALNILLIPRFGIVGAGIATLSALAISAGLFRIQLGRLVPLGGCFRGWLRPAAVLVVAAAVSRLVAAAVPAGLVAVVVGGATLVVIFALGIRLLPGCLEDADLQILHVFGERLRARRR